MTGRLPLGRRVVDLAAEPRPYLSAIARAELVASCPPPYDRTLDAIVGLAYRSGRRWAGRDRLEAASKVSWRTIQRHRAWLVEHGYLIAQGGGHRGATARYLIVTPAERAAKAAAGPPPAWSRIADPADRAEALAMDL